MGKNRISARKLSFWYNALTLPMTLGFAIFLGVKSRNGNEILFLLFIPFIFQMVFARIFESIATKYEEKDSN